MAPPSNPLLFVFVSFFLLAVFVSGDSFVGVTVVGGAGPARLDGTVSYLLKTFPGLTRVRLADPSPDAIRAFSYSGVSLLLSLPNSLLPAFAADDSAAGRWLSDHVAPFHPRARVAAISLGREVLSSSNPNLSTSLLPALGNLQAALRRLGLRRIAVSTAHSFDIVKNPFPPSAAQFHESVPRSILRPLLRFLSTTNSSFLINLYPYHLYRSSLDIPIGFALFQDQQPFNYRDDLLTGDRYRNLFDVMVDAVIASMADLGHGGIPVVVAETGWPTHGDANEPEASVLNAWTFNKGLVGHLSSGLGTPLKRRGVAEAYIFELFDEAKKKQGPGSARHWGILYPNMTKKYEIDFSGAGSDDAARLVKVGLLFCFMVVVALLWV